MTDKQKEVIRLAIVFAEQRYMDKNLTPVEALLITAVNAALEETPDLCND